MYIANFMCYELKTCYMKSDVTAVGVKIAVFRNVMAFV